MFAQESMQTVGEEASSRELRLIEAEYLEMPGLHLTGPQVQRLCGLDHATCDRLLHTLLARKFLKQTRAGEYVLARESH